MEIEKIYGIYLVLDEDTIKIILDADKNREIVIKYNEKEYDFSLIEFLDKLNIREKKNGSRRCVGSHEARRFSGG